MPAATLDKPQTETAFAPVAFWNALYPSESVLIEDARDPAARRYARFVAGCYVAKTPAEVAMIERHAPHAKRANLPETIACDHCGMRWGNLEAYQYHRNQHP